MGRRNSRTKDLQCSRADYRGKRQNSIAKDKEGQISDLQRELERRTPVQMPSMLQQNLHAPSSRTGIKQEPGTPSSESDVSYLLSRRRAYSRSHEDALQDRNCLHFVVTKTGILLSFSSRGK